MTEKRQLTDKQAAFVQEYCVDWNATQAAIRAGYSEDTARQIGSENLSKPDIAAQIEIARQEFYAKIGFTKERIVQEFTSIGMGKAGKKVGWETLKYSDKMNALDKMSKISALYTEKVDVDVKGLTINIGGKDADCC